MFMRMCMYLVFFASRRWHTRCALVTGVQTCALPIFRPNGDVALAVVSIDLSRTALHGQGRDAGEGHRALPTVHAHVGDRRQILPGGVGNPCADIDLARVDRKSVVYGKSVSVRVDLGGRSIINNTKKK